MKSKELLMQHGPTVFLKHKCTQFGVVVCQYGAKFNFLCISSRQGKFIWEVHLGRYINRVRKYVK